MSEAWAEITGLLSKAVMAPPSPLLTEESESRALFAPAAMQPASALSSALSSGRGRAGSRPAARAEGRSSKTSCCTAEGDRTADGDLAASSPSPPGIS